MATATAERALRALRDRFTPSSRETPVIVSLSAFIVEAEGGGIR